MIRALELENFKAFGQRVRIEFAPITLILGENSAGKSSILQALSLLKQTRESREHGALLLPRSENGIVDLGSFQEMLFDHNPGLEFKIRVDLDPQPRARRLLRFTDQSSTDSDQYIGIELAFARPSKQEEISIAYLQFSFRDYLDPIARFEQKELTKEERRRIVRDSLPVLHTRRPLKISELRIAKCTDITSSQDFWAHFYTATDQAKDRIQMALAQDRARIEKELKEPSLFSETNQDLSERLKAIQEAEDFYRQITLTGFIDRMRDSEIGTLVALDGFFPQPLRARSYMQLPELAALRNAGPSTLRRDRITLDVASFAFEVGRSLETALELLYPMGPYRTPPQRWYIFTGTNPQDVGYQGNLLPSLLYRRPELVQETNSWLDRLEIGYHLDVRPIGAEISDLFEVRLVDTRRATPVNVALSDVGFGISQLLPFVVQSLASESQIITIEQPEVHVHPRLQADLGDLLAAAIKPPREHRFIVETHSEHLVLRMQKLVRQKLLTPRELAIIYVQRGPKGAVVERLRLDDEGEFIDDWPGGFFPERLRELT